MPTVVRPLTIEISELMVHRIASVLPHCRTTYIFYIATILIWFVLKRMLSVTGAVS